MTNRPRHSTAADLRGASRLMIDAVKGIAGIVEDMHRNIAGVSPIVGRAPTGGAGGISGLVYRSVRGVTQLVGVSLDAALMQLSPVLGTHAVAQRETVLAALNGVLGDYLLATANPLAIDMQFRVDGRALFLGKDELRTALPGAGPKLLVMVHGLCMNDLQWQRAGHDHGAALASDLDYTAVYLHYNTGLPIADNGQQFAEQLEALVKAWPVPLREITVLGHSMGGLVTRAACGYGRLNKQRWARLLNHVVFLGTPLLGAPLERAGNWLDMLLGMSPYTAPFAKLGNIRSAGVKDLRHGAAGEDATHAHVALPRAVRWFAVAASKQEKPDGARKRLQSDGLVPVNSALGRHKDPALGFAIPKSHEAIFFETDHFDLLSSADVYRQVRDWLGGGKAKSV